MPSSLNPTLKHAITIRPLGIRVYLSLDHAFVRITNMKHLFLVCFFPMALTAQSMQQLTEQLGKTVLYGDVALSPDGTRVAWVQSTAASTSRETYVRETSGNAPVALVKIPISGERT